MKRAGARTALLLSTVLLAAGCAMSQPPAGPVGSASSTVTTVAGQSGVMGSAPGLTGSLAGTSAVFGFPAGMVSTGGYLYICDSFNSAIRAYNLASGTVSTFAGVPGTAGYFDNAGFSGLAAYFNHPEGITTDGLGNLYVADSGNNVIRRIVISTGAVSTVAGNAYVPGGSLDGTGTGALFNNPLGITFSGGNLYVADSGNHTLRELTPGGAVTTFAGQPGVAGNADGAGTSATFTYPQGIAADGSGNLYVADTWNATIRKVAITGAIVSTLAGEPGVSGDADGTGPAALFDWPEGIAVDATGSYLYVADTLNDVIRKVVISSGAVTTLAGQGEIAGSADGAGNTALFNHPMRVAYAAGPPAVLYVADTYNETVRTVTPMP